MRAVAYCRVSSQDQIDGTSLAEQKKQIEAYASLKSIVLAGIFVDAGVSGGTPLVDRPQGAKLLEALNNGEARTIIITKLDRGFRSCSDCLNSVERWDKEGINLHIIDLGGSSVDTTSASGKFMLTVLAAAAEMERARINERCNEGRKARRAEGKRIGEVPFGYDLKGNNRLEANAEEQRAIKMIHRLKKRGGSLRSIAQELNRRKIETKKGRTWQAAQVSNILKRSA